MENKIEEINELEKLIMYYRLTIEKKYYEDEIQSHEPKIIGDNENIFSKVKKNFMNSVNSGSYNSFKEKLVVVDAKLDTLKCEISLLKLNDEAIKQEFSKAFKDDMFGLGKLEFGINTILDSSYKYETNKYAFPLISEMLGEYKDYLSNLEEKMKEAYSKICLDQKDNLDDALAVGGVLSLILLISGVGGLVSAAATSGLGIGLVGSTAAVIGTTAVAGLVTAGLTYTALNHIDKEELKKEFAKLSVDETTYSLVRTTLSLIQMKKYVNHPEGEEIYNDLVEQYIDLKSDVDVRLFISNEDIEDNKKKNQIFSNADTFLKDKLFLEEA